ncbi:MAG: hypothetical protein IT557_00915 [Alphaproteobacteria bacterium]|nr:hypothetical protein [Alphaproteobacteria bacterium]
MVAILDVVMPFCPALGASFARAGAGAAALLAVLGADLAACLAAGLAAGLWAAFAAGLAAGFAAGLPAILAGLAAAARAAGRSGAPRLAVLAAGVLPAGFRGALAPGLVFDIARSVSLVSCGRGILPARLWLLRSNPPAGAAPGSGSNNHPSRREGAKSGGMAEVNGNGVLRRRNRKAI